MPESKGCLKCAGNMTPGALQKIGNYSNPPYVWAPLGEPPFPAKGTPSSRRDIIIYRCEKCGYLELYAPSTAS